MPLRDYLRQLDERGDLIKVSAPISKTYEIAGVLKQLEPKPVLFECVKESPFRVMGNLFCDKASFADYFGIRVNEIIPFLARAIDQRRPGEIVADAPCQEVVVTDPNLDTLPILRHCELDGGNYISSGVVITKHPQLRPERRLPSLHAILADRDGRAHRALAPLRHLPARSRQLDVAICVGNSPNVLAAAATSVDIGINELDIANALEPTPLVRAKTVDLLVPAEAEFVIEGTVYLDRLHAEGPFVDLTETYDVIRQEPVFVVKAITHRRDAIWQALLPGALEHKLLMGMPREPTIFKQVNEVVKCLDVNIDPGGCSWLHAIVQIDKQHDDDGRKAIEAAFAGHRSCKHVFVVDGDIDIYDPLEVEWALATRFQGDADLIVKPREQGSSLDPSSESGIALHHRSWASI